MTDVRLRDLERLADAGNEHDRARLLVEQARAGRSSKLPCPEDLYDHNPPTWVVDRATKKVGRARRPCSTCGGTGFLPVSRTIRLAAVLGDPVARLALGWPKFHGPTCTQETIGPRNEYITHVRQHGCLFTPLYYVSESIVREGAFDLRPMTAARSGKMIFVRAALGVIRLRPRSAEADRVVAAIDDWLTAPLEYRDDWLITLRAVRADQQSRDLRALLDYVTGRHYSAPSLTCFASTDDEVETELSDGAIRTAIREALVPLAIP